MSNVTWLSLLITIISLVVFIVAGFKALFLSDSFLDKKTAVRRTCIATAAFIILLANLIVFQRSEYNYLLRVREEARKELRQQRFKEDVTKEIERLKQTNPRN